MRRGTATGRGARVGMNAGRSCVGELRRARSRGRGHVGVRGYACGCVCICVFGRASARPRVAQRPCARQPGTSAPSRARGLRASNQERRRDSGPPGCPAPPSPRVAAHHLKPARCRVRAAGASPAVGHGRPRGGGMVRHRLAPFGPGEGQPHAPSRASVLPCAAFGSARGPAGGLIPREGEGVTRGSPRAQRQPWPPE